MKKMSSERKVKRIIYTAMILIGIALFAPYFYIRVNYNIPPYIFFICIIPLYIGAINLFSKWLVKSKWKDTFNEMEEKAKAEEKAREKRCEMREERGVKREERREKKEEEYI